ncbi:MAG: hypothetical protein KDD38_04590 [Bdellovibrionales bacterium]|nr:hypothetical protein [Bdellovibrionales bacterium]
MNMKIVKFSIICGSLLTIAAGCSNGGPSISKNAICPGKYDPLAVDDNKKYGEKLSVKPGEPFSPPASEYNYKGSEIYYYDTDKDIKVHLSQTTLPNGEEKTSIVCVGGTGITRSMEPLTFSVTLVSDILANENSQMKVKHRIFSFDYRNRLQGAPLQYSVENVDADFVDGTPQNSYQGEYNEIQQTFATVTGAKPTYQLVAHLAKTVRDDKSNKDSNVIVRTLVSLSPESPSSD